MKVSPRSYQILWDVHGWTGAIASLVVFACFFFGPFAAFHHEMSRWQEPRFREAVSVPRERVFEVAERELAAQRRADPVPTWVGIILPHDLEPWINVWKLEPDGTYVHQGALHPATGEALEPRSDLGEFLNGLHFLEPVPGGHFAVGAAAIALLLLVGTGLVMQLGKLGRELVQFRPRLEPRWVWTDLHKLIGVVASPFVIVLALSGAILCFGQYLSPTIEAVALDGAEARDTELPPASESAPAPFDLHDAWLRAERALPEAEHSHLYIDDFGTPAAALSIWGRRPGDLFYTHVLIPASGEQVVNTGAGEGSHDQVMNTLHSLHFGAWASPAGKALYSLLSLLVAFGILAGNLVWIERRAKQRLSRFDRLLAKLSSGVGAGLVLATAALFAANQLLPRSGDSIAREHLVFYVASALALAYALYEHRASRSALRLLVGAAAVFFAVPLVDALRTGRIPFDPREPYVFGVELGLWALGLSSVLAARVIAFFAARGVRTAAADAPTLRPEARP